MRHPVPPRHERRTVPAQGVDHLGDLLEGSGGAKGDLPDGTFETTQDMTVQEIQSINR